ncbi:MAG: Gfo/Idh/MocA family oxidoreductase [Planctomycetes bacterium]|nr:Gfo/Idh/MocA family oxidoreductase [Planctomycetota bacterium]
MRKHRRNGRPRRNGQTRRTFLRRAGAASIGPWIVPESVFGADGRPAPSNRITLGFIGVGMMGRGHLHRFVQYPEVDVLAVCDVDRWRREDARATVERTYGEQRRAGTFRGCHAYNDLRELLARPDIDAVVIATGDRWHATATVLAAKAGKDIYCEKPASLTIAEARAMIDTVRRYGRVFQTGLQQRSAREFRLACQLVRDGALGKVQFVYVHFPGTSGEVDLPAEPVPDGLDWDLWLGPAPWRPFNSRFHHYGRPHRVVPWDFCRDFGGGNLTSNAVHAFDVVQWGLGMDDSGPTEIIPPQAGPYADLTYKYANGVLVQVVNRRLDRRRNVVPDGWDEITSIQPFGALFVGERGWIHVGRNGFLESFPADIVTNYPARYSHAIAVADHHHNWLEAIRTRRRPACDVAIGCRSTIVSHLGCIAYWTGRTLKWDPAAETFPDDDEANRMRRRAMRQPWSV